MLKDESNNSAGDYTTGDLLIRNGRLINGQRASVRQGMDMVIKDGLITEIGKDIQADGIPVLDADGSYVLPGLIDSHMHIMWGPAVALHHPIKPTRENWTQTWGRNYQTHLKAYLACGVTTIHDMAAFPFVVDEVRSHYANGGVGPRYLTLGPMISPPNGYANALDFSVTTERDVEERLDTLVDMNVNGVKTCMEKGWSQFGGKYQRHSPAVFQAIKKGAEKRHMPLYVHATDEEDLTTALNLGVHCLAHTLILRDKKMSDRFIENMAQTHTYQMSTLSTMDAMLGGFEPERMNEPLLDIVVPEDELAFARNPKQMDMAFAMMMGYGTSKPPSLDSPVLRLLMNYPWLTGRIFGGMVKLLFSEKVQRKNLAASKDAIRRLHEAGVPIVMGSDAACTPNAICDFHGFLSIREMELLGEAGLSPHEAIKAATSTPAKMLGLENQIGAVQEGRRADLVIVRENPLENLRAMRGVQWTVKDGVARTPQGWMAQ